jgi:uncharacterized protein (DUF2336 family)
MIASQTLVGELDDAIRSGASNKRVETLRRITDLFLSNADHVTEPQVEVFGAVMGRLIDHIENKALIELGQRLAPERNAPIDVIRQLAQNDEIAVAGPVLSHSTRLTSSDLLEIAKSKPQAHLLAISNRNDLQEDVTDVLVERGNDQVARSVASNECARFSATGFAKLVQRAETTDGLAELVAIRSEISAQQLRELALKATDAVRQRLLGVASPEAHAKIEKVLTDIASEINRSGSEQRDYAIAQDLIRPLVNDKASLKAKIAEFAGADKFEETVAALAALSRLKIDVVEQSLMNSDEGGTFVLCRAIALEWPTVIAILSLTERPRLAAPPRELAGRYAKLNIATAERILRFWQIRSNVKGAADQRQPHPGWGQWSLQ